MMKAVYLLTIFILLSTISATLGDSHCHHSWYSFNTKCYKVFIEKENFNDAEFKCEFFPTGHLVSITTVELYRFLLKKIVKYNENKFWIGLTGRQDGNQFWNNGVPFQESVIPGALISSPDSSGNCAFLSSTNNIMYDDCQEKSAFICETNQTLYDAIENCQAGLPNKLSFIGEETGRCIFSLPGFISKSGVHNACSEYGGQFMDLDEIMREGLNSFYEHKVLVNTGHEYWTNLTFEEGNVIWKSGDVLQQPFLFISGLGSCITVVFNFTTFLETHLIQTSCNNQAYAICGSLPPTTSTPPVTPAQQRMLFCPAGHNWKSSSVTGACYWETSYETYRMSWDDARSYCKGYGGDLASFHSIDEEKIGLSFQYGSLAHPYWIGLKLDPETETYKWSDGSQLDYTNWAPNHPDHKDKRLRCVAMNAKSKHWISSLCGIISWFVCKSPRRQQSYDPVVPTRPPLIKCDDSDSAFYFNGYCYTVVNLQFSWHRAKQYCENEGSTLVSIHTDEEIGFLLRMLYDDKDTKGNRVWIGLNSLRSGVFRWTDWSPVDFTYWNENEPNNNMNQEKCCNMYMMNGLWNDENCNSQMGFICKRNKDATSELVIPSTMNPEIGNCKKGWFAHRDRCYLPRGGLEKDRLNWADASKFCHNEGGYITSIRDANEQAYLAYLMQGLKEDTWIGLHDTIESGKYYWVDNSDILYTNWAVGEPSMFGIQEDCVKMVRRAITSGVWHDDRCSKQLPFICQMDKDPNLPRPVSNRGNQCIHPVGWLKLDGSCFKIFEGTLVTWKEAETACRRDGAHLISITGSDVLAVANYLGTEVNQTFWIGLKGSEENTFSWLNDWPINFTKWNSNEPKSFDENLCYASTYNGYWERFPCTDRLPYICHITTGKPPPQRIYKGNCPSFAKETWISTDGSYCLHPYKGRKDWYSAFLYCLTYGSYLVSIHSFKELEALKAAFDKRVPSVFLGFLKNTKGGFSWADGSPVDYVNWEFGEPENEEDFCVEMMMDTLKWKTISCSTARHFACAHKKDQVIEVAPKSTENGKFFYTDFLNSDSDSSTSGLSIASVVGILVAVIFVMGFIIGIYIYRTHFGKGEIGNFPFRQQSVSFDNALYSASATNIEFKDSRQSL